MRLKWPGFNEKGNVIIGLADDTLRLEKNNIDMFGETFSPKEELHVTLIGSSLGLIIRDNIQLQQLSNRLLEKIFEEIDWSFKQTGPVHLLSRLAEGGVEESIILLIDMPGVETFYEQLTSLGLIEPNTPVPPAHITLYTRNCPLGIGVPNDDVLNTLSKKVLSLEELEQKSLNTSGCEG